MMRSVVVLPVWAILRRLALGLVLITVLSGILLLSDLGHRKSSPAAGRAVSTTCSPASRKCAALSSSTKAPP